MNKTNVIAPPCNCCGKSQWNYEFTERGIDLGNCGNCGLHYIAQMPTQEVRITEIKKRIFTGGQLVANAQVHKAAEVTCRKKFLSLVQLVQQYAPPGKWLDIGCGTGTLISVVQEMGREVEGIELTPDRRELSQKLTGAKIHSRSIEELDMPAGSFAVITLTDVFSHLTNPMKTFECIRDILCTGGIMMLYTSEIGSGVAKHHNLAWNLGEHLYFLGENTIEKYAERLGFELIYREKKWAPDLIYSRETFLAKGRSKLRNFIKSACVYTPGVLPLLRCYMLNIRNRNNHHYASTLLLKKTRDKTTGS
jgi:2-polyprenyl-3-methyl-5-hydroxy-6-metoxy-1,4-benzoquinol methylase